MEANEKDFKDIFSFHFVKTSFLRALIHSYHPLVQKNTPGLRHGEWFRTMNLGTNIASFSRFNFSSIGYFCWWSEEAMLDQYLADPKNQLLNSGWHVRMKLYRRWGGVAEINQAPLIDFKPEADQPVVAVTLARLKLSETMRFIKFGRPVERQVRDHRGQSLALAGFRPIRTFSTFSIWQNEAEMTNMVQGHSKDRDGEEHQLAMKERNRKPFHFEFATMRFKPIKEMGTWQGKSGFTAFTNEGGV